MNLLGREREISCRGVCVKFNLPWSCCYTSNINIITIIKWVNPMLKHIWENLKKLKFICIQSFKLTEVCSFVTSQLTSLLLPRIRFQKLNLHYFYKLIICWTPSLWPAGDKVESYSSRSVKYLPFILSTLGKKTKQKKTNFPTVDVYFNIRII